MSTTSATRESASERLARIWNEARMMSRMASVVSS